MKRFILLLITTLLVSSCVVLRNQNRVQFVNATIYQVIDSNTALAITHDLEVLKVVTREEIYFDGRPIIGLFVLVDTYAYNTMNGRYKVVPVYIRYSEYQKYRGPY